MNKSVITSDPEIMGGTPVFRGTRVPAQALLDYLEAGDSIVEFLEGLPIVNRKQGIALLEPRVLETIPIVTPDRVVVIS